LRVTAGGRPCSKPLNSQPVTSAIQSPGADERPHFNEALQIPRGHGTRCSCDREIILGAQASLESPRPFSRHAQDDFILSLVPFTAQAIEQPRLFDEKLQPSLGFRLRS